MRELKKYLTFLMATVITGGGGLLSVRADQGTNGPEIHGIEEYHQSIVLTATSNAPTGAMGTATFDEDDNNGSNAAVLVVETEGLSNGTYTLSVTDIAGTNTYELGAFVVGVTTNSHHEDDYQSWTNGSDNATNQFDSSSWTNWVNQSGFTNHFDHGSWTNWVNALTNWVSDCNFTNEHGNVSHAGFTLPVGVTSSNLSSLAIADSNTVVDLVGDFSSLTNGVSAQFDADVDVLDGPNGTNVLGNASISLTYTNGKQQASFQLSAHGGPAKTKLNLLVNGSSAGTVHTDKTGSVVVKSLHHVNLSSVKTIVIQDNSQHVVFSAQF